MVVYGFPSNIAALQFEHAWQRPHQTHYIANKITKSKTGGRSVHQRMANARLLINSAYFSVMGLRVHLASPQVLKDWDANRLKVPGEIGFGVGNVLEMYAEHTAREKEISKEMMERLSYGAMPCALCSDELDFPNDQTRLTGYCPGCGLACHLLCLASSAVDLVPRQVVCPGCKANLRWTDVVRRSTQARNFV